MSEEYKPFASGSEKEEPQQAPIYYDKSNTPTMVSHCEVLRHDHKCQCMKQ